MNSLDLFKAEGISPGRIVDMVVFQDRLYVATEEGVFVKIDGQSVFKPLKFMSVE